MRVCFICSEYPPGPHGGIGTMTQVLGRALVRRGHEVRAVGVYPTWYKAPELAEDQGVQIFRMTESSSPLGWMISRYHLYRKVADWVRAGEVDIVEVPDYQGWAAGWQSLRAPVVTRLHGSLTYFANELSTPVDRKIYWLERASLRRSDYSCSVCRYTAQMTEQVFKFPMSSTAVLYNPVESPAHIVAPRADNQVVFSGTLTPKKGIISLIKAWPAVVAANPAAELHVYGKDGRAESGGSLQQALLAMLPPQILPTVHFHGHVARSALFDAYRIASAAVFPSYAEAFAIAPLEAMACGCPTIFSRRGSGPELLTDGREGLLVDPDQPAEISAAILRTLRDPKLAAEMGEAGRVRVEQVFSIDNLVTQNVNFYQQCVLDFRKKASLN